MHGENQRCQGHVTNESNCMLLNQGIEIGISLASSHIIWREASGCAYQ